MKYYFNYLALGIILFFVFLISVNLYKIDNNGNYFLSEKDLLQIKENAEEEAKLNVIYSNNVDTKTTSSYDRGSNVIDIN